MLPNVSATEDAYFTREMQRCDRLDNPRSEGSRLLSEDASSSALDLLLDEALHSKPVSFRGQIVDPVKALNLLTAGNATITLVSKVSGARFTYKIRGEGVTSGKPFFVSLLRGSDNDGDFSYLGTIFSDGNYRHGRKSNITPSAPSARAFEWLWRSLCKVQLPETCELWHEGRCCRCGRKLTVPESIASGLGPDCAGKGA